MNKHLKVELNRTTIIKTIKEELPFLKKEFYVKKVGIFDLFVNQELESVSNINLLIEFQYPVGLRFFRLIDYLEKKFSRRVDILTPAGIKSIRRKGVAEKITKEVEYIKEEPSY